MSTQLAPDVAGQNFLRLKEQYGIYEGSEIGPLLSRLPAAQDLVESLIPPRTVNLMVGDSGIGKSPLVYQLALAIATGTPFLGMSTRRANVLMIDYENSLANAHAIMRQQRRAL